MANPPEDSSLKHFSPFSSSLGESGFLPHRPMSSGIESITQGFRFAAPGRKHLSIGGGVGGAQEAKNAILSRERTDTEVNGTEALKVSVPMFSSTRALHAPESPPSLHTAVPIFAIPEEQMMLPPSPSQRPSDRGRNTSMVREKRKCADISGLPMLDTGAHKPSDGNIPARLEGSGVREDTTRKVGRKALQTGAGTPNGERRPKKKRQVRPAGLPNLRVAPSPTTAPSDRNSRAEIIVLDDDVKVEPTEANDPATVSNKTTPRDDHDIEMNALVQIPEPHQRRSTFKVHVDQTAKHHALQWKDSNRRIGARLDAPNEIVSTSNLRPREGARRASDQGPGSHRSGVNNGGVLKKRSEDGGHIMEPQSQQPSSRTTTTPFSVMPVLQEQEQSSTGEHRLLVALTTLTTEKQVLERKLHETIVSLKTQVIRAETSEKKNSELESQAQKSRDNISGLKKKMMGFQKFVDGLGKDYNMLNEKNSQLNNRLNEVAQDRDALFRSLQDVRFLAEKVDGAVQGWGSSRAALGGANREIEKLDETLKFLHSQLSENAGLLAMERDRTQSLECQIQEDRKRDGTILTAIQDGKLELAGKLTELQNTFKANTGLELEEKITELQKAVEIKIEADGRTTRSLVGSCLNAVEKLKDREVDAAECLIGVEKRINHTSDSIVGVFQETHKMNVEALTFTDGYIGHLNSKIKDLEAESKEMREKHEFLLMVSVEKKQLEKELEQELRIAIEKCNEMSSQVERGKEIETVLNESISTLQQKLSTLDTRSTEDLTIVEAMKDLEQKNCDLQKECEMVMSNVQDANLSLQTKGTELENLRAELKILKTKYKGAGERIEGFEKEKAEFMALAEEQNMKERIAVETNANMFRQRETSRLNNQIKALEAQKERLETENKGFRTATADGSDLAIELRNEITKLQAKYKVIEKTHAELLQEKSRLESFLKHSTQLEVTTRSGYSALEKRIETTGAELSEALEQIGILHNNKELMLHNKQQELEDAISENRGLREDATALRTVERQLREALNGAEIEKGIIRKEKEDAIRTYEALNNKTKELEQKLEQLREVNKKLEDNSSSATTGFDRKPEAPRKENETPMETQEAVAGHSKVSKAIPLGNPTTEQPTENWGDDIPPLSPLTSPERILETQAEHSSDETQWPESDIWSNLSRIDNAQFERYIFGEEDMVNIEDLAKNVLGETSKAEGQTEALPPDAPPTASRIKGINKDSQTSQTRKNMATKFASCRKTPAMALDNTDDAATTIEDFSDDDVAGVDASSSRNTHLEHTNPMLLVRKPRSAEERESKNRKRAGSFESTPAERYSFIPATSSNKPKTPQRTDDPRGGLTDDGRKSQCRPRKERGKKNKDDQEWAEEGGGSPKNNKGKEESPNMKKSLRSYKDRKKSAKRFV